MNADIFKVAASQGDKSHPVIGHKEELTRKKARRFCLVGYEKSSEIY